MPKRPAFRPHGWERLDDRILPSGAIDLPPPTTPIARQDAFAVAQHELYVAMAKQGGSDVLFLGDSITYYWGDMTRPDVGSQVWDAQLAPYHAANFGIPSDIVQNLLWRVENGELDGHPKAAVVLIGTNNLGSAHQAPADTAAGIAAIVQQIRTLSPDTKILLMGIFPRGANPDDPLRQQVQQTNMLLANLGDGDHVRFLDIGWRLEDFDGTIPRSNMYDYLHLNYDGFLIWANALRVPLQQMLLPPTVTIAASDQAGSTPPSGAATAGLRTPDQPDVLVVLPQPGAAAATADLTLTSHRPAATRQVSLLD